MSAILVFTVLAGFTAASWLLLAIIDNKQKRKAMNQLLQQFNGLGSAGNLAFSSQEVLKDVIFGLDGLQRKILVLRKLDNAAFHSCVIDLNEVKSCTVKKYYGTIRGGELAIGKLDQYLKKMVLHFELNKGLPSVEILFYRDISNTVEEIPGLENKARNWEIILSKMCAPVRKIV